MKDHLRICALSWACTLLSCSDRAAPPDAGPIDARPPTGSFTLSWTLSDGQDARSCSELGAQSVAISLATPGGFAGESEAFTCGGGEGTSRQLDPGIYDVEIDLRASMGRSLLSAPVRVEGFEIVANAERALPDQAFVVAAAGDLEFFVDAEQDGDNCESMDDGGADIASILLELRNSQGSCVPAQFVVAEGSQPGGTLDNTCVEPAPSLPCIGADQKVSVVGVPSGDGSLVVRALLPGGEECYERTSSFSLPGGGLLTDLGSINLPLTESVECDPDFVIPDAGM